jgi:23S rRNA (pseudouridine1915-N3)-methyltransferase
MRLLILSVGQKMPDWVAAGVREYAGRLPGNLLQLVELPLGTRTKAGDPRRAQGEESQRLLKAIPDNAYVVALDPRGRSLTTEALAERLDGWLQGGRDVVFLIGGPEGLTDDCLTRSDERWSLSGLTFPHMLVRVIVAEQLYRAWTILRNHPYHR